MKNQPGFKTLAGVGAGLLLLGTAWLAHAAITITRLSDGFVCTDGTVKTDGTVVPDPASCRDPSVTTYTLTVTKLGSGVGTLSGAGLTCGANTCSATYNAGSTVSVTVTANPTDGSSITWAGDCTPLGITSCVVNQTGLARNLNVTATFTPPPPPPPPGDCGVLPPNTVVVDTGNLNANWVQQMFLPVPQQITAFKVTVPSGFSGRDNFQSAGTASSTTSKWLVVSTCPGVLTPAGGQNACSLGGSETTTMRMSTKSADPSYYCKLTPGTVYYVNAVSKFSLTDTGFNCSNTTDCSFYASRAAPY